MKTRSELKAQAKQALSGNWGWAISLMVVPSLLIGLGTYILLAPINAAGMAGTEPSGLMLFAFFIGHILLVLASINLNVGIQLGFLDLLRGKRGEVLEVAAYGFSQGRFGKIFGTNLLMGFLLYLWSLLLVIPAYIKFFAYSMANYVLKDSLDKGQVLSPSEAITRSRQLMDGHKWDLFVLTLSFFGWYILSCLTLGLGFLWLIPYVATTYAAYYEALLAEENAAPAIETQDESVF